MSPAGRVRWARQTLEEKLSNLGFNTQEAARLETLVRFVERTPGSQMTSDIIRGVDALTATAERTPSAQSGFTGGFLDGLYDELKETLSPEELEQLQKG